MVITEETGATRGPAGKRMTLLTPSEPVTLFFSLPRDKTAGYTGRLSPETGKSAEGSHAPAP